MTSTQNGSQGDAVATDNSGLATSTGALIPDPGTSGAYQWGIATGGAVALSFSFPGGSATWATDPNYSNLNEPGSYTGLDATEQTAVRSALSAWAAVAKISFTEVADGADSVGQLRFAWTQATQGGASAWAYFPNSHWASGSDVWLAAPIMGGSHGVTADWASGGNAYMTLLHEIGHALGLKHPFEGVMQLAGSENSRKYTVMAYNSHPNSSFLEVGGTQENPTFEYVAINPATPMLYDILAIQHLYGANTAYNAGDTTYSFDPGTPFIRTIWDGSGTDTISAAGFTLGCTINLTPGSFSKLTILSDPIPQNRVIDPLPTYDGTDNLAIAFNCWIENAIGGSGADQLTGNALANTLAGGLGDDILDGGIGLDLAVFAGSRAGYSVVRVGAGWTVTDTNVGDGNDGADTLTGIERLQFSDQTMVLPVAGRDYGADGKSDILFRSNTSGALLHHQKDGFATTASTWLPVLQDPNWTVVGTGDYNGDGKNDILLGNSSTGGLIQYQMNGTTVSAAAWIASPGAGFKVVGNGDYNGDGKADILFRNTSSGALLQHQKDGFATTASAWMPILQDPNWTVVGNGDYNGDGKSDVLLGNSSTGGLIEYQINGTAVSAAAWIASPGAGFKVVGNGDYNGDGKADLLFRADASGALLQHQKDGFATTASAWMPILQDPNWTVVGTDDYNGDGKSDVLLGNAATGGLIEYQINGTAVSAAAWIASPGAGFTIVGDTQAVTLAKAGHDFDGDGKSDLLLRNSAGSVLEYKMNGATVAGSAWMPSPGPDWFVVGTGDYNGDGKSDLLFRNNLTGGLIEFQMNGSSVIGSAWIGTPGASFQVVGNGDYNGDGKADILFRNAAGSVLEYQMNGTTITSSAWMPSPGADWTVAGTGDYNGDGKSDLLFRNSTTGGLIEFQMNGSSIVGSAWIGSPGLGFQVVGSGDYNGDGKSDILFRADASGALLQHLKDGFATTATAWLPTHQQTTWNVVGNDDYNGDGRSDIVMRDTGSGATLQYQMNGAAVSSVAWLPNLGTDWVLA